MGRFFRVLLSADLLGEFQPIGRSRRLSWTFAKARAVDKQRPPRPGQEKDGGEDFAFGAGHRRGG